MAEEQKGDYGTLSNFGTRKYGLRPGWEEYARKAEREQEIRLQNAKLVLKEKRMKAGNTLYVFTAIKGKNEKTYLKITGTIEKINYKGSVVVMAPYVPDFLRVVQQLSKELGV